MHNASVSADDALLAARARIVHDLHARGFADAVTVSIVEDAVVNRRWWVEEWPEGEAYVAGQLAQDVQEALLDRGEGRWPLCTSCAADRGPHELHVTPDLGPDPVWVCEQTGAVSGPLGALLR